MSKILKNTLVNTRQRPTHKATVTFADVSTATSGLFNYVLPYDTMQTGDVVENVWVNCTTQFNGASVTSCKISVGDTNQTSGYVSALDIGPQVGVNQYIRGTGGYIGGFGYTSSTLPSNSTSGLVVSFTTTGNYVSNLTSGSVDIYYTHISTGSGQAPLSSTGTWTNEFFW